MTQLRIKELLGRANLILDKGFHFLPGFVMVKSSEMEAILDRIDASIPEDIKEAESILRRREEIQIEAQQRAERVIAEARNEAEKILSESELLSQVQREAERIKEQVLAECQQLRDNTIEEAKRIRAAQVAAIVVEVDGMSFNGDEVSQSRMSRAILSADTAGLDSTVWVLADDTVATVTKEQLKQALAKSMLEMGSLWTVPYEDETSEGVSEPALAKVGV